MINHINDNRWFKEEALIEKWHIHQLELANLLQSYDLMSCEPVVDWHKNKIRWRHPKHETVMTAKMRQLCRYSPNSRLLTLPIPNHLKNGLLPILPEYAEESDENGAWLWAIHFAEAENVQYLYRLSLPYIVLFIGLSELEVSASAREASLKPASDQYISELLEELEMVLQNKPSDPTFVSRFFSNSADSILRYAMHFKDESYQEKLRQTGNSLKKIAKSFEQASFGILSPAPLSKVKLDELNRQLVELSTAYSPTII